mgnify:CR=1 FL=1
MWGLLIPFIGTTAGAACVFLLKDALNEKVQKTLLGFASGVMVAASVWSLLIPAMDMSSSMGKLAFLPAAVGFALGMLFLLAMDRLIPHMHLCDEEQKLKGVVFRRGIAPALRLLAQRAQPFVRP